jgi:purine nucleoside permease
MNENETETTIDELVGVAFVASALLRVEDADLTGCTSWQRACQWVGRKLADRAEIVRANTEGRAPEWTVLMEEQDVVAALRRPAEAGRE